MNRNEKEIKAKRTDILAVPSNEPASTPWRPHPCPICKAMSVKAYRPFCSRRCANIDLGRWLKGTYSFPDPAAGDQNSQD